MVNTHSKITLLERERILCLVAQGLGVREIARKLGRHHSSISRELRRDGRNKTTYSLAHAQVDRNIKASQSGRKRILDDEKLLQVVKGLLLERKWSPEQISDQLKNKPRLYSSQNISHETIYSYIYRIDDLSERKKWIESLRQRRKKRRLKRSKAKSKQKFNGKSIHTRPKEIQMRDDLGHWEGDLIMGKGNKTALATIVERKSRFTLLVSLKDGKTSDKVVDAIERKFKDNIPDSLRKSLTYDNGSEMALHVRLTNNLGLDVYFADPGCPGQRGTNENTNGLIRQFFPKKTDFNQVSEEEILKVEQLLNQRPRKILEFRTPEELFWEGMEEYKKNTAIP